MSFNTLQANKFSLFKNFITAEEAQNFRVNFADYCIKTGAGGDPDVPLSKSAYRYAEFEELLYEKVSFLNDLLEIKLFPTYSYARIYKRGAVLPPHTDRDACEVSVTVHLGGDKKWLFSLGRPLANKISLDLEPGDAVIYLGREVEHWREEYEGEEYTQVFLHYVNSRGPCARCKNDMVS